MDSIIFYTISTKFHIIQYNIIQWKGRGLWLYQLSILIQRKNGDDDELQEEYLLNTIQQLCLIKLIHKRWLNTNLLIDFFSQLVHESWIGKKENFCTLSRFIEKFIKTFYKIKISDLRLQWILGSVCHERASGQSNLHLVQVQREDRKLLGLIRLCILLWL